MYRECYWILHYLLFHLFILSAATTDPVNDVDIMVEDWPKYQASVYCNRWCQHGQLIEKFENALLIPDCYPCDCGRYCKYKGTCCPSIDQTGNYSYDLSHNGTTIPSYVKTLIARSDCYELYPSKYLSVISCPEYWMDLSVKEKCERPNKDTIESIHPYVEKYSGVLFRNRYCVECNGLHHENTNVSPGVFGDIAPVPDHPDIYPLPLSVKCYNLEKLIHLNNESEIYTSRQKGACRISFPVERSVVSECPQWIETFHGGFNDSKDFARCSSTGNEKLNRLCHELPPILALRVWNFKNIFCYMCDGKSNIYKQDPEGFDTYAVSMEFLWKAYNTHIHRPRTTPREHNACITSHWEDDKGVCVAPMCSSGKVLEGNNCKTALLDIFRGLRYTVNVTLGTRTPIDNETFHSFLNRTKSMLKNLFFNVIVTQIVTIGQEIDVEGHITGPKSETRDDFEKVISELIAHNILFGAGTESGNNSAHNTSIYMICMGTELCGVYRSKFRINSDKKKSHHLERDIYAISRGFPVPRLDFIELVPSLVCPYVTFNVTDIRSGVSQDSAQVFFAITLRRQQINITWSSNLSFVDGQLRICVAHLRQLSHEVEASRPSTHTNLTPDGVGRTVRLVQYYLDIVSMCVSCVLLAATIITHLLFPSLRTTPGLNTLCLCTCLLCANASLLFTSLLGMRGLFSKSHCLFHAVFLHYSWIASFVWMNTCCIHMYRVFTGLRVGSNRRHFVFYCLYSFGSPFFVVVSIVVITHTMTHGHSIGYSRDFCFLDIHVSVFIITLGLLTPLFITVSINSFLFVLVVREMFAIKTMQQQTKSSHGVWTYAKLSTVTGSFLLVSAIGAQFDNVVLSLLSTPLSALQGIFIFTSFMANKRIVRMYSQFVFKFKNNNSTAGFRTTNQSDARDDTINYTITGHPLDHGKF